MTPQPCVNWGSKLEGSFARGYSLRTWCVTTPAPSVCGEQDVGAGEHPVLSSLPDHLPFPARREPLSLLFLRADPMFTSLEGSLLTIERYSVAYQTMHSRKFSSFGSEMPERTDEAQYLFSLSKVFSQWNEKNSQDGALTAGKTVAALKTLFPGTGLVSPAARGRGGVRCQRRAPG